MVDSCWLQLSNVLVNKSTEVNDTNGLIELHEPVEKSLCVCDWTDIDAIFLSFCWFDVLNIVTGCYWTHVLISVDSKHLSLLGRCHLEWTFVSLEVWWCLWHLQKVSVCSWDDWLLVFSSQVQEHVCAFWRQCGMWLVWKSNLVVLIILERILNNNRGLVTIVFWLNSSQCNKTNWRSLNFGRTTAASLLQFLYLLHCILWFQVLTDLVRSICEVHVIALVVENVQFLCLIQMAELWVVKCFQWDDEWLLMRCFLWVVCMQWRNVSDVLKGKSLNSVSCNLANELAISHLLERHSRAWIYVQTLYDQLLKLPAQLWFQLIRSHLNLNALSEHFFSCAMLQGKSAMWKLIQDNSKSPDISLASVKVFQESFRWHAQWCTDFSIIELFSKIKKRIT